MNKTVNINLANTFFHIDEEAYNKLRRYLESIKRSFSGTAGSDEIIADIEARIAELFAEKMEHDRQVITQKEVDAVINVMGQPEDYMVDEDIFEDEPKPKARRTKENTKKLYRDTQTKFIGGVCAGLEHYLGFDALWIRIIFILSGALTGFGIIAYILLWILVPEAVSTSQKLDMRGEPINISNIERKVKEGFDDVADKVKSVDYQEVGNKVKSGSKTFFDTIGDIFMFFFRIFGKFIGILLIIIGAATLIGLFVGLVTAGVIDIVHFPGVDFYDIVNTTGAPVWLVSILLFFVIGIPFFFLLYLGLKILVSNLKSIGRVAKFSLLGLWLLSIGVVIALGVRQAAAHAFTGTTTINKAIGQATDTLAIRMEAAKNLDFENGMRINGMTLVYDDNGNSLLYDNDVRLNIKKSEDSIIRLKLQKDADGRSFEEARLRSEKIDYTYTYVDGELSLADFITTGIAEKMRDQQVRSTLFVPAGTVIKLDESTRRNIGHSTKNDQDLYRRDIVDYLWAMGSDGELKCQSCSVAPDPEAAEEGDGHIIINKDGVDIDIEEGADSFKMTIDENGVEIKANEKS